MKRILATALLAIVAYGTSSQALGECSQLIKEYIQNAGGSKEAAIARTRYLVTEAKNNKSGAFWKLPRNQRQEMFAALDEDAKETISDIQSCTDSDLASITPKSKGNQSGSAASTPTQRCGNRIDTGTWNWGAWRVVSESPLSVLKDGYTIPSPESNWESELFRNINYTINNNAEESERRGAQKMKDWLLCLSGRGGAVAVSAGAGSAQSGPNSGNASEAIGQRPNPKNALNTSSSQGASAQKQTSVENCVCGPDYIACHERNFKRGGSRYQVFRENGYTSIVSYDNKGEKLTTQVWRGGNNCSAAAH